MFISVGILIISIYREAVMGGTGSFCRMCVTTLVMRFALTCLSFVGEKSGQVGACSPIFTMIHRLKVRLALQVTSSAHHDENVLHARKPLNDTNTSCSVHSV